jgi:peptide/nickel transport system permease protein
MFLAAGFLMLLSLATIVGVLISDLLLAWLDPRIRYGN